MGDTAWCHSERSEESQIPTTPRPFTLPTAPFRVTCGILIIVWYHPLLKHRCARCYGVLCSVLLWALLISGCAGSMPNATLMPITPSLTPTEAAATEAPSPTHTPGITATIAPSSTSTAQSPTPSSANGSTNTGAMLPPTMSFDVNAQAAALLPAFAADLEQAEDWDRYQINARLDPALLTVSGAMRLDMRNRAETPFSAIYFHLYPNHADFGGGMQVSNVYVNNEPAATTLEQNNVLLRLDLPQPLNPDEWATVTLNFQARTQRNASRDAYGAFNQEAGVWALANFYPVLSVYADSNTPYDFTEWDRRPVSSRGDLAVTTTALYDVTLDAPPDWMLVTTGARYDSDDSTAPEGLRRERFVSGPQRDFFVAALQGLDRASADVDGTLITAYYQPANAEAGQAGLATAAAAVRAYNERYGRYPLTELEIIQAALMDFLGVEYPGVVLIDQDLYQPGNRLLETTVAHEIAHQWWYNLVGNDYQGEPWIDEGLASYSQIVFYESLGNDQLAEAELQTFRNWYTGVREAGRDDTADQPVTAFQGNYVALVYAKSALFFQALRNQLGDEVFFRFLQEYYATHRYGEANSETLLAVGEDVCACNLQPIYNAWIGGVAPVNIP